ncbi:50S ribosomal protein L13 [uncultured archaeon]|nr:50S ribosomal protein L13 [uncultured archaeon]
MAKIIINAEGGVYGRICSYAAKQALEGNEIIVVNAEKSVLTGNRSDIIKKYTALRKLGSTAQRGPYYPKVAYMMFKRGIRGMLPTHRWGIGREAFKRIKCYDGIPKELEKEKMVKMFPPKNYKFIELKEIVAMM